MPHPLDSYSKPLARNVKGGTKTTPDNISEQLRPLGMKNRVPPSFLPEKPKRQEKDCGSAVNAAVTELILQIRLIGQLLIATCRDCLSRGGEGKPIRKVYRTKKNVRASRRLQLFACGRPGTFRK